MAADSPTRTRADVHATSPTPRIDALVADLHQAHALTLVRMANLLLRDKESAEDVVQDAFIGLYRALPRLTDHDQILPYLLRGCGNCRTTGSLSPSLPSPGQFVIEATHGCALWFYQFRLTGTGRLADLRPVAVPEIPGGPMLYTAEHVG